MTSILLAEDDDSVRQTVSMFLELEGYAVEAVSSTREAFEKLAGRSFPVVVSDIYIDDRTGLDILGAARAADPHCAVILMSARGSMETVMAATRGGAFDYLAKPFEMDDLLEIIQRAVPADAAGQPEDDEVDTEEPLDTGMIGSSPSMIEIYKTISRVAPTDALVLIEGETGTGKELASRWSSTRIRRAPPSPSCPSIALHSRQRSLRASYSAP